MARTKRPEPRKTPSQERSRQTVDVIIEAAAQVFERHGYAAGTTNRIAERAGVSIGSLYQYFPNKEAILAVLLERHAAEAEEVFGEVMQHVVENPHDVDGILRDFVEAMVRLHASNPKLQHVLLEEAPRPAQVRKALSRAQQEAMRGVELLLEGNPEVRLPDVRAAAYLVVQSVECLTHRYVVDPPPVTREEFVDELVALLRGYLVR
jgi:AcrR family transcriptional regulator